MNDEIAYDILPVQSETNHDRLNFALNKKNSNNSEYNSQKNLHTLKKRNLRMETFCDLNILNKGNFDLFFR